MVTSYHQGETTQSIAMRYGTSHLVIIPVLLKHGVKLRSRHESHSGHSRHTFDARYFRVIVTEEKVYWLGFLAADGCITIEKETEENPRITLCLASPDIEHLTKFKQALQTSQTGGISKHSCSFTVRSTDMARDLAEHGIQPRKALHTIPTLVSPELEKYY
jgi:hypothetical protein